MKRSIMSMLLAVLITVTSMDMSAFAMQPVAVKAEEYADNEETTYNYLMENERDNVGEVSAAENNPSIETLELEDIKASGECGVDGDNLTWELTSGGVLTISGNGMMKDYDSWLNKAPWSNYLFNKVIIKDEVTSIGDYAFHYCDLYDIEFSAGLKSIGEYAFDNCDLQEVELPAGLESIANDAFRSCTRLRTIVIPNSVKSIGTCAFDLCVSLQEVTLPGGITKIPAYLFRDCTKLQEITVPDGVTWIEYYAFENCSKLRKVTLPDGITHIGEEAFSGCSELQEINLPSKLQNMGKNVFKDCNGLQEIMIPESLLDFISTAMQPFSTCTKLEKVILEEGGSNLTIPSHLFKGINSPDLKVEISSGIRTIGEEAFLECIALKEIEIPDTVWNINEGAFSTCTELEKITLSNSIRKISARTFENCISLKEIIIPDNSGNAATSIEERAFLNCISLEKAVLPKLLEKIGTQAFKNCSSLKEIIIPECVTSIESGAFTNCSGLKKIIIPERVTSIGAEAFQGCSNLKEVIFLNPNTSIGEDAFRDCSAEITIYGVKTESGEEYSAVEIYASDNSIPFEELGSVEKLSFETEEIKVGVNGERKLEVFGTPIQYKESLSWESEDESIAIVDKFGVVRGLKEGSAIITAKAGEVTASVRISVEKLVTDIRINGSDYIEMGMDAQFSAIVFPEDTQNQEITWKSSDETVATVNENGVVAAVSEGTVQIMAFAADGSTTMTSHQVYVGNMEEAIKAETVEDLQSEHPYADEFSGLWIYEKTGEGGFDITFSDSCELARGMDYLYIYDENGKCVEKYIRNYMAGKTISVKGSKFTIRLESDDSGNAYGFQVNQIQGSESGTCGENLKWTLFLDGVLEIEGEGAMEDYEWSGDVPWKKSSIKVKEVQIQEGVTSIGKNAFYSCSELTNISMPNSMISIGESAFSSCDKLERINIPDSVTSIGFRAFYYCDALKSITLPEGLTEIEREIFYNCSELKNVVVLPGVTNIGGLAFGNCSALSTITLPEGIESIEYMAFQNCSSLREIILPEGLTSIDYGAFENCTNLTEITIPKTLTAAGGAFTNLKNLKKVIFAEGTTVIPEQILENVKSPVLEIELPDSVTRIEPNAFSQCTGLKSITLPEGLTYISGFSGCTGLSEIKLPDSVTTIGDDAFYDCTGLSKIELPEGVTTIGSYAFCRCSSLSEIDLPENLNIIGSHAFNSCTGLEEIMLPEGVTTIESHAFNFCTGLREITLPDSITTIGDNAFCGCSSLNEIIIPEGITSIPFWAFGYCNGLSKITIPSSVETIGDYAFYGCGELEIYGYVGSYAQTYAESNHITFITIEVPIESLSFEEKEVLLAEGEKRQLQAVVLPANCTSKLSWSSDDDSIATVDESGIVTGVSEGTTKIWVSAGELRASVNVTVVKSDESVIPVKSIFIQGVSEMEKGDTAQFTVTVYPSDATNGNVIWRTSDEKIATITKEGVVTALEVGTVEISATAKDGSQVTGKKIIRITKKAVDLGDVLEEDVPKGGAEAIAEGLWVAGVQEEGYVYTGEKIIPEIRVYHHKKLLEEKKDYTVSYKNNKNATEKAEIHIKGKGNYSDSTKIYFTITALDICGDDFEIEPITVSYTGKVQKKVPTVLWKGTKLKKGTDFEVTYPDKGSGAYKENGTHKIHVEGSGNFKGSTDISLEITDAKLMSKVKATVKKQTYTGKALEPQVEVKHGKVPLVKDVDYSISYYNNVNVGSATVILTGIGNYSGTKKVNFKIEGIKLKGAKVSGLTAVTYNGKEQMPEVTLEVKQDGKYKKLTKGVDYKVKYSKHKDVGTATVTFEGMGGYTGTLKKSFKIKAHTLQNSDIEKGILKVEKIPDIPYVKLGSKPEPSIRFNGILLTKGVDYTLSYKNNKMATEGNEVPEPTVIIKGKKNFKGNASVTFNITKADLERLKIEVEHKVYSAKNKGGISIPKITDTNGKQLKYGVDYELKYTYKDDVVLNDKEKTKKYAGDEVKATDKVPIGTIIKFEAQGIQNYEGNLTGEYQILEDNSKHLKNAKVGAIEEKVYTGKPITLTKKEIMVKMGKSYLTEDEFEIVADSYEGNTDKGTASVYIRGLGEYHGTKKITFKIVKLSWK